MLEQESRTEITIIRNQSDSEDSEPEIENQENYRLPFIAVFCILLIISSVLIVIFSLAINMREEPSPVAISPREMVFEQLPLQSHPLRSSFISADAALQQLENNFLLANLQQIQQQNVVKAERLNQIHVNFKKSLRNTDFTNAQLQLAGLQQTFIGDHTDITFAQFLQALELLKLGTVSHENLQSEAKALLQQQYSYYKSKWNMNHAEKRICAVLLFSSRGLANGDYYYGVKGLLSQKYRNYKVIFVDNTPEMGVQSQVLGLIKELSRDKQVIVLDRVRGADQQSDSLYFSLHKYCKDTDFTIFLQDRFQLIGNYVFSLLNEVHQQKQVPIVMSHYLLDLESLYSDLHNDFRYKVQLYPRYQNPTSPRSQPYKTKYLKSYSTELLLSLPHTTFQNNEGYWIKSQIQAFLEFAVLEKACGKHLILSQILLRVPKSQLQERQNVVKARSKRKLTCGISSPDPTFYFDVETSKQYQQFEGSLISAEELEKISGDQEKEMNSLLLEFEKNRIAKIFFDLQNYQAFQISTQLAKHPGISQQKIKSALDQLKQPTQISTITKQQPNQRSISLNTQQFLSKSEYNENQHILIHSDHSIYSREHRLQHQFCLLLLTQNNVRNFQYFYSLQSILKQNYQRYKLVILDNASTDHTPRYLRSYIQSLSHKEQKKIHFYGAKTKKARGQLIYFGFRKFCQAGEIIIIIKGGEQLIGPNIFTTLDAEYRTNQWLAVYSNNIYYQEKSLRIGISNTYEKKIIETKTFRNHILSVGSLKSFKSDLLFNMDKQDFKTSEGWSDSQVDFNISYAMLQMGCQKVKYLPEIMYRVSAIENESSQTAPLLNSSKPKYNCLISQ